jgi:hypothetical protein
MSTADRGTPSSLLSAPMIRRSDRRLCMEVGGPLLTRDRHFESIDQIDKIIL